jgi:hypothetical protein
MNAPPRTVHCCIGDEGRLTLVGQVFNLPDHRLKTCATAAKD